MERGEAATLIDAVLGRVDEAVALVGRSALPEDLRKSYQRLLGKRTRALR